LREPHFFNRIFIDQDAIAWPGNIDLAPGRYAIKSPRIPAGGGKHRS
jgi:hypothetical protein